jgi:hypothetical protein
MSPFLILIAPLLLLIQGYYGMALVWTLALIGFGFLQSWLSYK